MKKRRQLIVSNFQRSLEKDQRPAGVRGEGFGGELYEKKEHSILKISKTLKLRVFKG
jgi:hypothetical protein